MTALRFVVSTVLDLYILTYILRFASQWVRADPRNPFWQFVVQITNPLVRPLRQVVPGWRGFELASLLLVVVLETCAVAVLLRMSGYPLPGLGLLVYYAFLRFVLAVLRLYFFALLIYVILSWVSPDASHPLTRVLSALCEPLLRPVRRFVPTVGGFDLSPLIVMIVLQALTIAIPLPSVLAYGP
jgi:YggT family protein